MSNGDQLRRGTRDPRRVERPRFDARAAAVLATVGLGMTAGIPGLALALLVSDESPGLLWVPVAVAVVAAIAGRQLFVEASSPSTRAAGLGLILGAAAGVIAEFVLFAVLLAQISD